ncbi:MAG: hypothetical protein SGJ00_11130 [bacterium]|nr:hypothetical protein [bacterium]
MAFSLLLAVGCTKTETKSNDSSGNNSTIPGGGASTPSYFFTCKVNGIPTDFKAMTLIKDDPSNIQQFYLIGQKSAADFPSITFTLNKKNPGWVNGLKYVMDEYDLSNLTEYKAPNLTLFKSTATPSSPTSGLRLNFDIIDLGAKEPYAAGTFSGTLQLEENTNTVVITEGKFKVLFLN